MKRIIFLLSMVTTLVCCTKEKETITSLIIHNNSSKNIEIMPYRNGGIYTPGRLSIPSGSGHSFPSHASRGISKVPVVFPSYLDMTDSIVVVFDGTYRITHLLHDSTTTYPIKHYLKTSVRNLGNLDSYISVITSDKKHKRFFEVKYTFTQQDYLDAQ